MFIDLLALALAATASQGANLDSKPACSISTQVNVLYCIWRKPEGQLRYTGMPPEKLADAPDGPWSPTAELPEAPGGVGRPAVVQLASGRLLVAARGADGRLRTITYQPNQGRWFAWRDADLTLAADETPSCVAIGEEAVCYAGPTAPKSVRVPPQP
ncbi:MAG: hypothetical protein IT546_16225 [Caulobacteraceae bacterium]|nr:hypothetical protein [Caulobacteraceae bacterium]